MLPDAVACVRRGATNSVTPLLTLRHRVRSPLSRCRRRKKQNPRPTRPVGSAILAKPADSLAPLASPRRAPGANRGLPSFCIRSRPSPRSSLGVRTVKANPPPSRRKSKALAHTPAKHAARWSGNAANSAACSTSSARPDAPSAGRCRGQGLAGVALKERSGSASLIISAARNPLAAEMPLPRVKSIPPALPLPPRPCAAANRYSAALPFTRQPLRVPGRANAPASRTCQLR